MPCFPIRTNKTSKNRNHRKIDCDNTPETSDGDIIIEYEKYNFQHQQPNILVHSYRLFDYNTCQWSNVVENTYWNGYQLYKVYVPV